MTQHCITCKEVLYPVGLNMKSALDYVEVVTEYIKDNVDLRKKINLLCTGSSGSILSSLLYSRLSNFDVYINHIKKENENSHSGSVFSIDDDSINIIFDDFTCSGRTISRICQKARNYSCNFICHYLILSNIGTVGSNVINDMIRPNYLVTSREGLNVFNREIGKKEKDIAL